MTRRKLSFIIPGPLDQRTGGTLYDARMVGGLRAAEWTVDVRCLEGTFPDGDEAARSALAGTLASLPDGCTVLIDGLAMGGIPGPIRAHGSRLRILSLVHHPLADETGLSDSQQRRFRLTEREALGACAGAIVTSAYTARRLESYGVPRERIRVVPPGTDAASPAEGPEPGAPPRLLCVATVTPRKGHDVLISALERIKDLPWTCVCAGSLERDPDFAGSVQRMVAEAALGSRIELIGECGAGELDDLYRRSTLFVLPSHYEGFGMALTEALARGLPVVSTTGGAIPYTVPADAGILVAPGDPGALAMALRAVLALDAGDGSDRAEGARPSLNALASAAVRHGAMLPAWPAAVNAFAAAIRSLTWYDRSSATASRGVATARSEDDRAR